VAYGGISPIRRRALHLQVAEALEALRAGDLDAVAVQIASHFEQAGRPQPAVAYYRRAASAAQRIYANAEAIRLYQHLLHGELNRSLSATDTCAVMLALGEVWRLNGQWAEAAAINRKAEAVAAALGDIPLQAQAHRALADILRLQGHYDAALEWLAKAEVGYESAGNRRGVVSALWTMGEIYWFKGDNPRALAVLERQLGIATEIDDQRGVCEALDTMGMVYWGQGDWDRSVDCCQRSIAIAEPLGYHPVITRAAITLGNVYSSQYATAEAVRWYLHAGLLARQIDDRQVLSWAIANTANKLQDRGDYLRALAGYEQAARIALEIGDRWTACLNVSNLGDVARRQNKFEQAELLYRKAAGYGRRLGIPSYLSGTLVDLARLLLEHGRAEEAASIYAEAVELIGSVAGKYLAGEDTRFSAQVLGIRLRHAPTVETQDLASLPSAAPANAAAELQALLHQASTPAHQAALWYELWRIAPDNELARTAAANLSRSLFAETGLHDYRQRFQELTGETLPDPPPLPDVSELIPLEPTDLDSLPARLEPLLAQLDASFD
jgi:tetratricopeptide (TPR) repeat protein